MLELYSPGELESFLSEATACTGPAAAADAIAHTGD